MTLDHHRDKFWIVQVERIHVTAVQKPNELTHWFKFLDNVCI